MTSTPIHRRWLEQWQARLQAMPEPKTEESIVFRILVELAATEKEKYCPQISAGDRRW